MTGDLAKRVTAEALGTALLLAAVVGSGIMAQRLAGGNVALALLCNAIATGATLIVLILIFGPLSGAHFNPVVSASLCIPPRYCMGRRGALHRRAICRGRAGVLAAHLMFDLAPFQLSQTVRTGPGQWLSEAVATFGLLLTIFGCLVSAPASVPYAVGLYITAAYWFTASTSFANPAVTVARSLSDTFAGIAPGNAPAFLIAQIIGAILALAVSGWLWRSAARR